MQKPAEMNWHDLGPQYPKAYEWFYFDFTEPDAAQISVSFLAPNPFDVTPYSGIDPTQGPRCATCSQSGQTPAPALHAGVSVNVSIPNQSPLPVQQFFHVGAAAGQQVSSSAGPPWTLQIGASRITRTGDPTTGLPRYDLTLDVAGPTGHVTGELTFRATHRAWMVNDNGLLFEEHTDSGHAHWWAVHVPRATVSGSYTIAPPAGQPLKRIVTEADGYHDHNWGTRRLVDAFQRWTWARGSAGEQAVVAVTLVPHPLAGPVDLRVSSLLAVSDPTRGPAITLFNVFPGAPGITPTAAASGAMPFPQTIDVGPPAPQPVYRAVFEDRRVALEVPGYQRRVASLTLYGEDRPTPDTGLAVAETLFPSDPSKLMA